LFEVFSLLEILGKKEKREIIDRKGKAVTQTVTRLPTRTVFEIMIFKIFII